MRSQHLLKAALKTGVEKKSLIQIKASYKVAPKPKAKKVLSCSLPKCTHMCPFLSS
jgi:hypothetical protein